MEDERRLFHLFVSSAITEIPANGEQLMANSEWRTANSVKKLPLILSGLISCPRLK
jgi:hypothetical protein